MTKAIIISLVAFLFLPSVVDALRVIGGLFYRAGAILASVPDLFS